MKAQQKSHVDPMRKVQTNKGQLTRNKWPPHYVRLVQESTSSSVQFGRAKAQAGDNSHVELETGDAYNVRCAKRTKS